MKYRPLCQGIFINAKEELDMPPIRKQLANHQFNDFSYWDQLLALMPKDDPLRKEVNERGRASETLGSGIAFLSGESTVTGVDGKEYEIENGELLDGSHDHQEQVPRYIPVDAPEIQQHLAKNKEVLDKVEAKYGDQPGHEMLMAQVKILRTKEENLANGVGFEQAPGISIITGDDGVQKFQDVLCDLTADQKPHPDDHLSWQYKDPAVVEQSMKELGITAIETAYVDILDHSSEWEKEFMKPDCDPAKLRQVASKFQKDIETMDGAIKNFEEKCKEDMKRPEGKRKLMDVTVEKNIANGDFFYDPAVNNKPGRAINGPNWEIHKKIFTETLENQLLAADLKKAMRDSGVTAETSPLAQEVQGLINGCMLQYEQDDQNRFYKKNVFQFSSIMRAVEIQKIEALAKQNPDDPFAKVIAGIAEEHRKNPVNEVTKEKLQAMSEAENTAMENEIRIMKLEAEDARLKTVQDSIKAVGSPLTCPEDKNLGDYFEEQKAAMADKLAELVAVKTIATTVKSYKAGNEDLGEKMSDKEVKELTDELLTEDSISQYKQDTAQREDFKRMIDSIKTWDDLAKFKEDATIHGGNKIMDKMAQQRKTILQEEKQAEAVQKQVQKQEELEGPAVQAGKPPVS